MSNEDRQRLLDDIENGNELTFLSAAHELINRPLEPLVYPDICLVLRKLIEHRLKELAKP